MKLFVNGVMPRIPSRHAINRSEGNVSQEDFGAEAGAGAGAVEGTMEGDCSTWNRDIFNYLLRVLKLKKPRIESDAAALLGRRVDSTEG